MILLSENIFIDRETTNFQHAFVYLFKSNQNVLHFPPSIISWMYRMYIKWWKVIILPLCGGDVDKSCKKLRTTLWTLWNFLPINSWNQSAFANITGQKLWSVTFNKSFVVLNKFFARETYINLNLSGLLVWLYIKCSFFRMIEGDKMFWSISIYVNICLLIKN